MAISQSSLLIPQLISLLPSSSTRQRTDFFVDWKGPRTAFSDSLTHCSLKNNRFVGSVCIPRTVYAHQQNNPSNRIVRAVAEFEAVPVIVESAIEEIDPQPDTSDGGGFGGSHSDDGFGDSGGDGGGGGGGDKENNNSDENNENRKKKGAMSMSQKLTLGYAVLVGVGGIMGYVKSGSHKSLAAGGLSALLLYYVYTELPLRPTFASSLGLGLSAALLAVMGSRFKKSGKIFPAGVVSFVSLVMTGGYFHGILRGLH